MVDPSLVLFTSNDWSTEETSQVWSYILDNHHVKRIVLTMVEQALEEEGDLSKVVADKLRVYFGNKLVEGVDFIVKKLYDTALTRVKWREVAGAILQDYAELKANRKRLPKSRKKRQPYWEKE